MFSWPLVQALFFKTICDRFGVIQIGYPLSHAYQIHSNLLIFSKIWIYETSFSWKPTIFLVTTDILGILLLFRVRLTKQLVWLVEKVFLNSFSVLAYCTTQKTLENWWLNPNLIGLRGRCGTGKTVCTAACASGAALIAKRVHALRLACMYFACRVAEFQANELCNTAL